jgi:SAM-dependent methyltransferase
MIHFMLKRSEFQSALVSEVILTYKKDWFDSHKCVTNCNLRDLPIILDILDPKPNEDILDVGCGLGRLSYPISLKGARVTGVDNSKHAIAEARAAYKKIRNLDFVCVNALAMNYSGCFDKAICIHMLEHLSFQNGIRVLSRIWDALRHGGVLVLGVPINDFEFHRRLLRFVVTGKQWRESTHEVSFSLKMINHLVRETGFLVVCQETVSIQGLKLGKLSLFPMVGNVLTMGTYLKAKKIEK